ncbi:MAG: helix-turn-helix transcriptional regulator [Deltaproteobacteria bacterium]|nr:helix-turn-helix transcriptional regulator [Deltaproteobacteria bacterium]
MGHERSFRVFERLAGHAQAAGGLTDFRERMLSTLLEAIGGDSASFLEPAPRLASQVVGVGIAAEFTTRYLANVGRYERSNARMFAALTRGPTVDHLVYSPRERERLEFYEEVLRPQGARSLMASFVVHRGQPLGAVVLKRHGRDARFEQDDLEVLADLTPALALAEAGMRGAVWRGAPALATLSKREQEVAGLSRRGLSNAEIALLLGTSRNTVKQQMQRAMEKLGARNRTELAAMLAGVV